MNAPDVTLARSFLVWLASGGKAGGGIGCPRAEEVTNISPAGDITLAVLIFLEQLVGAVVSLAGGGGGGCPGAEQVSPASRCYKREDTLALLWFYFGAQQAGVAFWWWWWWPQGRGSDQVSRLHASSSHCCLHNAFPS